MDNPGNSSLGRPGNRNVGEPRESGERSAIHGARLTVPGRTRGDSIARAPSVSVPRVPPATSQSVPRVSSTMPPVSNSAPRVSSPGIPAARMPSTPAVPSTPQGNGQGSGKPAVVYGTPLEEDGTLGATAALSQEELEAAGYLQCSKNSPKSPRSISNRPLRHCPSA